MITAPFLIQIFRILKKWLSRLARSSNASLFVSLLLLLRRFATNLSRHSDRPTCFSTGAIQGDGIRKDVFICSSLPSRKVIGNSPSPSLSDDPYAGIDAQSLQKTRSRPGDMPSPVADSAVRAYASASTKPYGFPSDSVSSLHLSQRTGESQSPPASPIPYDRKGKGVERGGKECSSVVNGTPPRHLIQDSSSSVLYSSSFIGPHKPSLSASQLRTPSLTSRGSLYYSAPSIATSRSRQSEYRTHTGPVHSRLVSIRGSFVDLHRGAGPESVSGIDNHYHLIVPPGDDELEPGTDIVSEYDGLKIGAMVANGVRRYERCNPRDTVNSDTTVPAMTIAFPVHDEKVPLGWITVVHPEGCRYFMNPEKRTFTEINICDEEYRKDIEYYMLHLLRVLESELKLKNLELDMNHVDLVIEPKIDNGSVVGNYYFVNHRDRCLFWLDDFDAEEVLDDCKGIKNLSHKGLAIQAQYWKHWDYFPSLCPVTQNLVNEVENMLVHATCDHLTSTQSSAAYDVDELRDYLSVIQRIKVPSADECIEQCHAAIIIGRIMQVFNQNAFINFHGEDCARLSYDQTVHGWAYKPSWWMVFLAPILFLEPVTQVQELHKIFADRIARVSRWNAFSSRLKRQLQDSNILATVLLNANVAFLGVSKGSQYFIQMATYMSLVASFGSIVLGLFFVSQDRTSGESTASEAESFLSKLHDANCGLQSLAIIYSLPKALLMWGMVFFFVAFSMYWCTFGDTMSRVLVGVMTLLVLVMIGISIILTKEGDHWWPMTQEIMKKAQGDDKESEIGGDSMSTPASPLVDGSIHSPLPSPSIFTTSTASVHSTHHRSGGNSNMSHSPHLRPSPSLLQGGSRSGHSREETPSISQVYPPGEAHSKPESDRVSHVHFAISTMANEQMPLGGMSTSAVTPSEHKGQTAAAATDSGGTAISPDPLRLDGSENEECIFDEPEQVGGSDSTTSLPGILGRGPTGDDFYYALPADGQDITETRDE